MLLTFFLAVFGWIIFRSTGMPTTLGYFKALLRFDTLQASYQFFTLAEMWPTNLFIVIMLIVEWLQRAKEHGLADVDKLLKIHNKTIMAIIYALSLVMVILLGGQLKSFIYFQF